jgi:hypothetical protein
MCPALAGASGPCGSTLTRRASEGGRERASEGEPEHAATLTRRASEGWSTLTRRASEGGRGLYLEVLVMASFGTN